MRLPWQGHFCAVLLTAFLTVPTLSQEPQTQDSAPKITVKMVPPEAIPAGTCKESKSGYLGIEGKDDAVPNEQQIGEYVKERLAQGYSVTLYPQASGRIYVIAHCEWEVEVKAAR